MYIVVTSFPVEIDEGWITHFPVTNMKLKSNLWISILVDTPLLLHFMRDLHGPTGMD